LSWEQIIERICDAPIEPNWIVGEKAGYHAQTSWFLLGEIARRLSGKRWETYATEEIFQPMGMASSSFAAEETCSPGSGARGPARELGMFYEMLLRRGASALGSQIILTQSVEALTARHRVGLLDHTFKHIIDWGLGFIINSAHYGDENVPYGYGRHASPRTFGHGGRQCCSGFADPEAGLAAAVMFRDQPGEEAHNRRMIEVLSALYEALGLAGSQQD
jgi:CubicO group peptidase (beta-lactamase class C family)